MDLHPYSIDQPSHHCCIEWLYHRSELQWQRLWHSPWFGRFGLQCSMEIIKTGAVDMEGNWLRFRFWKRTILYTTKTLFTLKVNMVSNNTEAHFIQDCIVLTHLKGMVNQIGMYFAMFKIGSGGLENSKKIWGNVIWHRAIHICFISHLMFYTKTSVQTSMWALKEPSYPESAQEAIWINYLIRSGGGK